MQRAKVIHRLPGRSVKDQRPSQHLQGQAGPARRMWPVRRGGVDRAWALSSRRMMDLFRVSPSDWETSPLPAPMTDGGVSQR